MAAPPGDARRTIGKEGKSGVHEEPGSSVSIHPAAAVSTHRETTEARFCNTL
jgi:hypothetical protein